MIPSKIWMKVLHFLFHCYHMLNKCKFIIKTFIHLVHWYVLQCAPLPSYGMPKGPCLHQTLDPMERSRLPLERFHLSKKDAIIDWKDTKDL
jgi:hypothetical protein